jgi:hypothetical protein
VERELVVSSTTPSDSATGLTTVDNYIIIFSEMMDNTTFTTLTRDTASMGGICTGTCSASFEYSSDDFDTCMESIDPTFTFSNSYKTVTIMGPLLSGCGGCPTNYKLRVTSGATDIAGNSLSTLTISI